MAVEEGLLPEDHARQHTAQAPHIQTVIIHLKHTQQVSKGAETGWKQTNLISLRPKSMKAARRCSMSSNVWWMEKGKNDVAVLWQSETSMWPRLNLQQGYCGSDNTKASGDELHHVTKIQHFPNNQQSAAHWLFNHRIIESVLLIHLWAPDMHQHRTRNNIVVVTFYHP